MVFHPAENGACDSFQRAHGDTNKPDDVCKRCTRPRSDHPYASDVVVALSYDERLAAIEVRLEQIERTLRHHERSIDFRVGGGG